MKKYAKVGGVVLCALLACSVANADISVELNTAVGALMVHGGTTFDADALPAGSMIQLVWSTLNAYSPSYTPYLQSDAQGNNIVQPGVGVNYWILWTGYTPVSATPGTIESAADIDGNFDYLNSHVGGNNVNAGYIYARIFDAAAPIVGTWYASSVIFDTSTFAVRPPAPGDPTPAPSAMDVVNGAPSTFEGTGDYEGVFFNPADHGQVVPEPSTIMLALAGVGLLVYRRLRK
ncbi:MAG: PEP-CTERM sorting domain-containing protein [Kiritimatiellae bacterium]|nr:PEP-CTERM sorting domain-containing protein [Kiritimatiellia bacterium]